MTWLPVPFDPYNCYYNVYPIFVSVLTPNHSVIFPVRRYEIAVHTGEVDNADTKANVFIIVKGAGGMTGRRALKSEDKNKFEKGKVRAFPRGVEC